MFVGGATKGQLYHGKGRELQEGDADYDKGMHRTMFHVYQAAMDEVYSDEMIHSCAGTSLMKGRAWETAGWFPGAVSPPADPGVVHTRAINGSVTVPYGKPPAFFTGPERRTTGLYLVPGGVGSVTVPASVVGKGLSILVGAHTSDHVNKDTSKRLDRVFTTVAINDRVTRFANPLGGGVCVPC